MPHSGLFVLGLVAIAATAVSEAQTTLPNYAVNQFGGSTIPTIMAIATGADGSVYTAGTTTATDLPVLNAAQPVMGEGLVLRSTDLGKTWQKLPNPPVLNPAYVTPHPVDPNIVILTALDGVYRSVDGGAHWMHVLTTGSTVGPDQFAPTIAIDPANPNWVFAAIFPARSP